MKLYYSPGACSLSPHIVLRETGQKFDLVKVDTKTHKTASGEDYYKINPKGYVPMLELDSGERLTEGPAIVQYLADQKGDGALAPKAGTMERVRLQEWLNYISTEVHKALGGLFNPKMPEDYKAVVKERFSTLNAKILDDHLAKNDFVLGKNFTVADAYLFTVLGWGKFVGIDMAQWPNISKYLERVASRPKVQEALKAEGLVK
ncbi:MAG: glutathione transferase GstA [Parvibaculaceae bacterium]